MKDKVKNFMIKDIAFVFDDTGLLFISDCLAKSVITTMFDFAADFGTDVPNVVSDSDSYTATGTCRIDFYITSEAEWFSHDVTYRIAMVSCNRNF